MRRKRAVSETAAFEHAISGPPPDDHYVLRLFVTGTTPRSARAIQNIRAICNEQLQGRYELEVVDIYQHPERAKPEQIVVAPTLIKSLPAPVRRLVGDLSNEERVLVGLDLIRPGEAHLRSGNGR
jgi:circadian clock protein KaiB